MPTHQALRGQVSATGDIRYRQIAIGTHQECALACAHSKTRDGDAYFLVERLEETDPVPVHIFPPYT